MFRRDAMFRQSFIQVFKGLAEFHGYVPPAPAAPTESSKATAVSQVKPPATPKPVATVSCC